MYRVRQQDLPFQGSSYQFVGADNGDVNVSVFLFVPCPAVAPGRTVIRTMKCSSYERAAASGL